MPTLREARTAKLWSIRDLAEQADVSPRTVVQIEARRLAPRFATMRKIAAALGVEPAELVEFAAAIGQAAEGKAAAWRDRGGRERSSATRPGVRRRARESGA